MVEIGKLTNDLNGNAKGLKELKRKKRKENFEKLKVRKGKKKTSCCEANTEFHPLKIHAEVLLTNVAVLGDPAFKKVIKVK